MSVRYLRWSYELLFSLYTANFVIENEGVKEGSKFLDWLAVPLVSFDRYSSHWRGGSHLYPPSDVFPNSLSHDEFLFLALILFVCIRLVGWTRLGRTLVDCIAISTVVIGPVWITMSARRFVEAHGLEHRLVGNLRDVPWLEQTEVVLVLVFMVLWRLRNWPIRWAVFFPLHFFFWGLIAFGQAWWRSQAGQVGVLLPLAAGLMLVWSQWFSRPRKFHHESSYPHNPSGNQEGNRKIGT